MNSQRLELIKMHLEILKMKADQYDWQTQVPDFVKGEIEKIHSEIKRELDGQSTSYKDSILRDRPWKETGKTCPTCGDAIIKHRDKERPECDRMHCSYVGDGE